MQQQAGATAPPPSSPIAAPVLPLYLRRPAALALAALVDRLLAERERWILWLPVCLGLGIALYFSLPAEPPGMVAAAALAMAAGLAYAAMRPDRATLHGGLQRAFLLALAALLLGFTVAQGRTLAVDTTMLRRPGAFVIEGRVVLVEEGRSGKRVMLDRVTTDRSDLGDLPEQVRITVGEVEELWPGTYIRIRARLMPPAPPSAPGAFDYARQAYFEGIGAVGFALGPPEPIAVAETSWFWPALAGIRQSIADRFFAIAPGPAGAVATALTVGLRGAIPYPVWVDFQRSGLAHLISISGLHISLVATVILLAVRYGLALIPPLALRVKLKKIAAMAALLGTFGYVLISGMSVPTLRSFYMTAVVLLAIMADRAPISMRVLALSACVVLVWRPESLVGASFQLSFAAVMALVSFYEAVTLRRAVAGGAPARRLAHWGGYQVLGIALTTVIASAATTPLSAFHFQTVATYGVLSNLVAIPLSGLIIMPAMILSLIAMPFGLDRLFVELMVWGVDLVLATAHGVAELPYAALLVTQAPMSSLATAIAGGLWLCLWRTTWRWAGLPLLLVATVVALTARAPDLLVDKSGSLVAARLDNGEVALSPWRRDKMVSEDWLGLMGQRVAAPWPVTGELAKGGLACDALGCILARDGAEISLAQDPLAVVEDCGRVAVVVTPLSGIRCRNGAELLDSSRLRRGGGAALRFTSDGVSVTTVAEQRGRRPWTR